MHAISTVPPPPAVTAKPFSLAGYRAFNDQLEKKYPEVAAARSLRRSADCLARLRRARGASATERLDALEDVVIALATTTRGSR